MPVQGLQKVKMILDYVFLLAGELLWLCIELLTAWMSKLEGHAFFLISVAVLGNNDTYDLVGCLS